MLYLCLKNFQGSSGSPPTARCCTQWLSCPVPQKLCTSSEIALHFCLIPDCCTCRCWFLFLFLILSHLTAKGSAHLQLCSVAVFWISSAPERVPEEFFKNPMPTPFRKCTTSSPVTRVLPLWHVWNASARRYNSPAGQRSHLSFTQ